MIKYYYRGVIMFSLSEYSDEKLKEILCEDAFDLFINSDNDFYLGDDGRVYEFRHLPDDEHDYMRVFKSLDDFNKEYPVTGNLPFYVDPKILKNKTKSNVKY